MNGGADWGPVYWGKVTGLPPSSTFTVVTKKACETPGKENLQSKRKSGEKSVQGLINSVQSGLDYSRYNDGPNADVPSDIPCKILYNLMTSYYSAHIKVTKAAAIKLSNDTVDQGDSVA